MAAMAEDTLIYMFPGQGAQETRMFKDIYEKYDDAKRIWAMASDISGEDLVDICMNKPFREMRRTDRAQMLITTCNLTMLELLKQQGIEPDMVIGHSAGELSALYACGAVDLEDALFLIHCRGRFMCEAAESYQGKMVAVMDIDHDAVAVVLEECAAQGKDDMGSVALGNYNANNQFVISGDFEAVTEFEEKIRKLPGVRIVDLKQQGAWHSCHMLKSRERFTEEVAKIPLRQPKVPLMMNYSAEVVTDVEEIRFQLTHILTSTVKWFPILDRLKDTPSPFFVEVGPNKILRGLLRRSYQHLGVTRYKVMNVNDCSSFNQFLKMRNKDLNVTQ